MRGEEERGREGKEKDERGGGGRREGKRGKRSNVTFRFREGHVSSLGPRPRQADEIWE